MILEVWSGSTSAGLTKPNSTSKHVWVNTLLTNNTASPATINISIRRVGTTQHIKIAPKNLVLAAGESFELKDVGFQMGAEYKLTTTANLDYYIILHEDYSKQW